MSEQPSGEDVEYLEIAVLGKPHGLRGEVTVRAISNLPARFAVGATWRVAGREVRVEQIRSQREGYVVALSGVTDRTAAEALRGQSVSAVRSEADQEAAVDLVADLIGRSVQVDGAIIGTVRSVEANPAHDLLVLDSGVLIPMVFVEPLPAGAPIETVLIATVPEGLLELAEEQANATQRNAERSAARTTNTRKQNRAKRSVREQPSDAGGSGGIT